MQVSRDSTSLEGISVHSASAQWSPLLAGQMVAIALGILMHTSQGRFSASEMSEAFSGD